MTYNYIALLGPAPGTSRLRLINNPKYRVVLDEPDVLLCCSNDVPRIVLDPRRGAIIGTLFDARTHQIVEAMDIRRTQGVLESGGRDLIEQYWGSYVAVVAGHGAASIVRDPSGAIPCYRADHGNWSVLTSDVRSCISLGLMPIEIDWPAVCSFLLWPERRTARTCMSGITELLPGCRLTAGRGSYHLDMLWNPWRFASDAKRIDDPVEAAAVVRLATSNAGAAWSQRYARPLVSVSGGLDSSIVLATTSRAAGAVTFMTHEPLGDEREYARIVADHCGANLVERELDVQTIDVQRSNAAGLASPVARLFAQALDRNWREAVTDADADALFHGGGGDNVFCYLASTAPYLDAWLAGRSRAERRVVAESLSTMTRVSLWRINRVALRRWLTDRRNYRWHRNTGILTARAVGMGEDVPTHPWFTSVPIEVLPGKREHVASLIRIQNHLEAVGSQQRVPAIAPLMSQPVVEACLRVPTWSWCRDGLNRAVARDAFRDLLPARILARRLKGSPAAFDARAVTTKAREITSFLRHGHLARRGLIDLDRVDDALGARNLMVGHRYQRVTELVDAEAWVQSWIGAPSDRVGTVHK